MAKRSESTKSERLRRSDPERGAPNRSGSDHIRRHTTSRNGNGGNHRSESSKVSEALQKAISDMVELSSNVIEDQIRAGQTAAERLRDGIAGSERLNGDVNALVEGLVTTTKDVGATWLELLSIIMRSIGKESHAAATPPHPPGSPRGGRVPPRTKTVTGSSGGAATTSSITPADPTVEPVPVEIRVTGNGVKSVTLDLRPTTMHFVPTVRELQARDPKQSLATVKFALSGDHVVLLVNGARGQAAGIYAGVIVDSRSNEPGGTVSVTVGE
jgi:hypothetical protein